MESHLAINKYYIPQISEFHVGFEYENFVKHEGWTKRTLECLSDYGFNEKGFCIDHEDYRVKCLDEQDIIYLGWHDNLKHDKDGFLYCIEQIENNVLITQIGTAALKQDAVLFFGNIKNKSELKRIMQMLKIIE
jgi:hypothetical protein